MFYTIRHVTTFRYDAPISESVMEVRMQPRTEDAQRCHSFDLRVDPRAAVSAYRDHLDNIVHHFDLPGEHDRLVITAESLVERDPGPLLPDALPADAWQELDRLTAEGDYWDFLMPSQFARPTPLLRELGRLLNIHRRDDPLSLLREINTAIFNTFSYVPQSTRVDSPIDDALRERQGVCQDYSHVMIALARELGIPCRYVSGYLFHRTDSADRSAQDATHAWVEALLPDWGWIGFDPTNNLLAGERHLRAAVGRDYADVPPTRGVFKGAAATELEVAVQVSLAEPPTRSEPPVIAAWEPKSFSGQMQMQQ